MTTSLMTTCRWNWCTQTFPDHSSLRVHVEEDHIANATPVKRKDVPLLRRAEDGASLQESMPLHEWVSSSDGSKSQPVAVPHRVERAVMTDTEPPAIIAATVHVLPPDQIPQQEVTPSRSGASTPTHRAGPSLKDSVRQMTFSEMRGTPSPAPSLVPSSPGTTAIINKMRQNTLFPVLPWRSHVSPHTTPRTPHPKPSSNPFSSDGTPKGRGLLPYTFLTPPQGDGSDSDGMRAAGAADPDASMEVVESQLLSLDDGEMVGKSAMYDLGSQWQPQSQLPMRESLENSISSPLSTINPKQLLAPLSFVADSQPIVDHGEAGSKLSPSKYVSSDIVNASSDVGTPRPPSSAPHPPSPSTMDISNIATTDSQEGILRTPARRPSPASSQHSSTPQPSSVPAADTSSQSQSVSESQGAELYGRELPFEVGFGYGYGDDNGESQPLQTQALLLPSSLDSLSYSQG